MEEEKHSALLSVAIVPQVVDIIAREEKLSDISAINAFYDSQTYSLLDKEELKIWHYSPLTIYNIWKREKETGEIELPEEGVLV